MKKYPMIVEPLSAADGGGFMATFPDLPGCIGDGETPAEAAEDGLAAAKEWLDENERLGRTVPPVSLGQWRQRVPRSLHVQLKSLAEAEGVSLNSLVSAALSDFAARRRADW